MLEILAIVGTLAALLGVGLLYSRIGRFETRMHERFDYVNERVAGADDRAARVEGRGEQLGRDLDRLGEELRRSLQALDLALASDAPPRYPPGAPHPELHELIASSKARYETLLARFRQYESGLRAVSVGEAPEPEPYFLNGAFPGRDAATLYALLCELKPKRFVEIGSGHSTRFAARAIRDAALSTRVRVIDPAPAAVCKAVGAEVIARALGEADPGLFDELEAGDILFIDGSHRCLMGSDVTVLFLEILPKLKSGVFVHFHDIFLPWDYPAAWSHKLYNEQYLLAALLVQQPERWEIVLPNHFLSSTPEFERVLDFLWNALPEGERVLRQGSSFWLKKLG